MKKIIALALAAVTCMSVAFTASATQEVTVTDKNFVIVEQSYGNYGYLFAKIENTGDEAVYLDNGKLVVFGANDDLAATDDYIYVYPNYLEPGQTALVCNSTSVDLAAAECEDFKFSVKTTDSVWSPTAQIPAVKAEYIYNSDSWNPHVLVAEITNTTDEVIYDFSVIYAVYDANGTFICSERDSVYDVGIIPGQSVMVKTSLNSDVMTIFADQAGLTPATCEAIVVYDAK